MNASGAATRAIIPSPKPTVPHQRGSKQGPQGPPLPATPSQPSLVKGWQWEGVWAGDGQIMVGKPPKGSETYDGVE